MIRLSAYLSTTLLLCCGACVDDSGMVLPNERRDADPTEVPWVRLVHLSDPQIIDEESPARIVGIDGVVPPAWRPQEAYAPHLLDGTVRAVNRLHQSGTAIDFAVLTGDATDNSQENEWRWFFQIMDGGPVDPLSGVDDRPTDQRPSADRDPHAPFPAEGLHRRGVHGSQPDIPWYGVIGNHDRFALGTFPILQLGDHRVAPLPLLFPYNLLFPSILVPTARLAFGPITPAHPGPPTPLNLGRLIPENPERRYLTPVEAVQRHFETAGSPPGHGFAAGSARTWYSVAPVEGLRLITLDSALPQIPLPGLPHVAGILVEEQLRFLETELQAAGQRGELVIVCTHHPSQDLRLLGSPEGAQDFRAVLRRHPQVLVHLAGHFHRNRVIDRGGYLEIETCSLLDYPQEARLIEIFRPDEDTVVVRYRMFSHLDVADLPDPLFWLRAEAFNQAVEDAGLAGDAVHARMSHDLSEKVQDPFVRRRWLHGEAADRRGEVLLTGKRARR